MRLHASMRLASISAASLLTTSPALHAERAAGPHRGMQHVAQNRQYARVKIGGHFSGGLAPSGA